MHYFVIGFISQEKLINDDPRFIYCTPGVNIEMKGDKTGQKYNTPQYVIEYVIFNRMRLRLV